MDTPNMLHTLRTEWAARGWSLDDLDAFRMEGPDINAVLDGIEAREAAGEAGTTPTPAAAPPAAPAPAAPAAVVDDADLGKFGEHAEYIKQLRQENAKYRTERNQLQERYGAAFEGLDDGDQTVFLEVVKAYKADPRQAAAWMQENAQAIIDAIGPEAAAAAQAAGEQAVGEEKPLTRAEYDKLRAEERQREQVEASVAGINREITDLGVDPLSFDGKAIMLLALEETGGDIKAAHAKFTARFKEAEAKAVEEFVDGKQKAADGAGAVTPQGGAAAPAAEPIKSVRDAGKAFEARLEALGYK